jgi:hypothetical protein
LIITIKGPLRGQKGGGSAKGGVDRRTFVIIITNFLFCYNELSHMRDVFMGMLEILEQIEAGERLEVITEWCGIPVKMKLTVWTDKESC